MPSNRMLTFHSGIVCDDVRREASGKDIIIGVYSGAIVVGSFPTNILVSLYVPVTFQRSGTGTVLFQVRGPHGVELINGSVPLEVFSVTEMGAITIVGMPLQVQTQGELDFQLKAPDGDWESVRKVVVRLPNDADQRWLTQGTPPHLQKPAADTTSG
jgi:hypothetical protein